MFFYQDVMGGNMLVCFLWTTESSRCIKLMLTSSDSLNDSNVESIQYRML